MIYYYCLINLILFICMGADKWKAKHNRWRIPEKNLFLLSLLGGGLGGLLGILLFSHKKRKWMFPVVYTASIFIHIALIVAFSRL